jgi:hypothetical protein
LINSKLSLPVAVLLVIGVTAAILLAVQPPAWLMLLLGSIALAGLYIVARMRSRFDPLDPRFGSCIPPITKPRDP